MTPATRYLELGLYYNQVKEFKESFKDIHIILYDDFKPKEQEKQVVEVVKDIKDKTIHLLKKEDQPVFFPDLPELDIPKEDIPEIKKIQVTEGILEGGNMDSTVKRISINKDYIVSNN